MIDAQGYGKVSLIWRRAVEDEGSAWFGLSVRFLAPKINFTDFPITRDLEGYSWCLLPVKISAGCNALAFSLPSHVTRLDPRGLTRRPALLPFRVVL